MRWPNSHLVALPGNYQFEIAFKCSSLKNGMYATSLDAIALTSPSPVQGHNRRICFNKQRQINGRKGKSLRDLIKNWVYIFREISAVQITSSITPTQVRINSLVYFVYRVKYLRWKIFTHTLYCKLHLNCSRFQNLNLWICVRHKLGSRAASMTS